jgi:hypothetical protein
VPRELRVNLSYRLVFEVLDPAGRPLDAARLTVSFEDPDGGKHEAAAAGMGAGRFALEQSFTKPGRHHVHVFPDASRRLHIWFDLLVQDVEGKPPEPRIAERPPQRPARRPAPPPAVPPPLTTLHDPAPQAADPASQAPEPASQAPEPAPHAPEPAGQGSGTSEPHQPDVIDDEPRAEPAPPRARARPQRGARRPSRPNPDGLE